MKQGRACMQFLIGTFSSFQSIALDFVLDFFRPTPHNIRLKNSFSAACSPAPIKIFWMSKLFNLTFQSRVPRKYHPVTGKNYSFMVKFTCKKQVYDYCTHAVCNSLHPTQYADLKQKDANSKIHLMIEISQRENPFRIKISLRKREFFFWREFSLSLSQRDILSQYIFGPSKMSYFQLL